MMAGNAKYTGYHLMRQLPINMSFYFCPTSIYDILTKLLVNLTGGYYENK